MSQAEYDESVEGARTHRAPKGSRAWGASGGWNASWSNRV